MTGNSRIKPYADAAARRISASTAADNAGLTVVYPASLHFPPENIRKSSSVPRSLRPWAGPMATASGAGLSSLVARRGFRGTVPCKCEAAGTIGEDCVIYGMRLSPDLIDEGEARIA
jgi:hypothetical protein